MKRLVAIVLLLALLLCGCQEQTKFFVTVNLVEYTVDTQERTISGGTYRYTYSSHGYSTGSGDSSTTLTLFYPDGGEYKHTRDIRQGEVTEKGEWVTKANTIRYASPKDLIWVLDKVDSTPQTKVDGWKLAAAALIAALSVLELVFPGLWIRLRCMWYVEDPEPSDSGIFVSRICSVISLIAAFLLAVSAFG